MQCKHSKGSGTRLCVNCHLVLMQEPYLAHCAVPLSSESCGRKAAHKLCYLQHCVHGWSKPNTWEPNSWKPNVWKPNFGRRFTRWCPSPRQHERQIEWLQSKHSSCSKASFWPMRESLMVASLMLPETDTEHAKRKELKNRLDTIHVALENNKLRSILPQFNNTMI